MQGERPPVIIIDLLVSARSYQVRVFHVVLHLLDPVRTYRHFRVALLSHRGLLLCKHTVM